MVFYRRYKTPLILPQSTTGNRNGVETKDLIVCFGEVGQNYSEINSCVLACRVITRKSFPSLSSSSAECAAYLKHCAYTSYSMSHRGGYRHLSAPHSCMPGHLLPSATLENPPGAFLSDSSPLFEKEGDID